MELMKVNRHCMQDAQGTEYYRNAKGNWKPGAYDGKKFVWQSTTKYAARKRTFDMPDGTKKVVRLTKYTYESFLKPAYAPTGKTGRAYKHAYQECYRALYWDGMELYKAVDVQMADGSWINSLEPFYAYDQMWDRWPEVEHDITTMTAEELDLQPAITTYDATEETEQMDKLIEADQFGTEAYDAACEAYDQRTEQISAAIVQTATETGAARIEQDGMIWYLHRSTRHGGLQLTIWDERGPVGHYDVTDGGDLSQYIDYQRGPVTVTAA